MEPAAGWTVVGRRGIHATNRAMAAAKRDYYDVLGVERGCEEKEIKAAYGPRTLSCRAGAEPCLRLQAAR